MNIGVIGPGTIGEVIIRKLRDSGYPVKMANARGPESLKDLAEKTGAIPVSVEQVVQDVDILFLAVPQKSIPGGTSTLNAVGPVDYFDLSKSGCYIRV
jgi:predicted dinucleotide-binding enzyme